ncbi:group XIIA secretory phospholipase A2 isoform X1 [Neocloeon triangulifer]|uniref:group XIIA secretory phospholipase A2 isoform X1 n=2 Tax=Neocloeon triangulifer TaxID=2078957 RepID=UPI00286F2D14|nr:group XIIA secretory phospholipase A2 isoform X1 [Neocloeon triangulifer]
MLQIPKMKILIYALTFLGYAYSGYGSGALNNLRDAVLAAETVFQDVLGNVVTVARRFRDIHSVFDAAVEETCTFKCNNGGLAVRNKYHTPNSDGCGSLGVTIDEEYLPVAEMTECCNQHDICYDTCNVDKEKCDFDFKRCLYKICEAHQHMGEPFVKGCKAASKMLFTATMTLGCKSYMDSQTEACYCLPPKNNKYNKYTTGADKKEL